jgi:hypothetical protein
MRALALALSLAASAASAQPALTRIDLPRFRIAHTDRAATAAGVLSKTLERERDELVKRLGRDWDAPTDVLVGEADELAAIAPAGVQPPPWAAGIALVGPNVLLLNASAVRGDRGKPLVRHELAHLALGRLAPERWPRWFQEGFAMLVAGEWSLSNYTAAYRASLSQWAIPLSALQDRFPESLSDVEIAYAESFSFVTRIYEDGGEEKFRSLIGEVSAGAGFADAFRKVYGRPLSEEESAWRHSLGSRYSWVPLLTGTGALWGVITALFLIAYLRVRRRRQLRLEQMELEEAARAAALRIAAAEQRKAQADENPSSGETPLN